jgi:hypothetical protein
MDYRDYTSPNSLNMMDSIPSRYNIPEFNDDESMTYDDKADYVFNQAHSPENVDTYSQKRKFIVDEEDVFKNMAATMRNPNVNKLNILDTLADYKNFKIKK